MPFSSPTNTTNSVEALKGCTKKQNNETNMNPGFKTATTRLHVQYADALQSAL